MLANELMVHISGDLQVYKPFTGDRHYLNVAFPSILHIHVFWSQNYLV